VNQLLNRFADAQKMMKQMGGMMGLPGARRKATKSPKNKRKGTKGGNNRPRLGGAGMPAGFPGAMPQLPPGLDPNALGGGGPGLPPGFKLPKLDFNKLNNPPKKPDDDKP
jgi:signal recognition particle subunit SRP54